MNFDIIQVTELTPHFFSDFNELYHCFHSKLLSLGLRLVLVTFFYHHVKSWQYPPPGCAIFFSVLLDFDVFALRLSSEMPNFWIFHIVKLEKAKNLAFLEETEVTNTQKPSKRKIFHNYSGLFNSTASPKVGYHSWHK